MTDTTLPEPMVPQARGPAVRTALYRHFDASGALLYVGISLNSIQRTMQHRIGARWFQQIARIDIEWRESRADAEMAEREAIRTERPLHNIVHAERSGMYRPGAPAKPTPVRLAVMHVPSGRLNGWFYVEAHAEQLLGWFRAIFPADRFELVSGLEMSFEIHDGIWLDAFTPRLWTLAEPDYEAGDAYDAEIERRAA